MQLPPNFSQRGLTRAWVVFHNGNKKHFASFDTSGRFTVTDQRAYGIRGLKKMVDVTFGGPANVKEARLYDTATNELFEMLYQGQWINASHPDWEKLTTPRD